MHRLCFSAKGTGASAIQACLCILLGLSHGIASLSSGLSLEPWKVLLSGGSSRLTLF